MIDIDKLLHSRHITVRWHGQFTFHNKCGYGYCRDTSCKGCRHTNYYIVVGKNRREYRLPNIFQYFLRKVWE